MVFYLVNATGDTLDLHEVTVNDGIRVLHTIAVRSGGLRQEIACLDRFLFKYIRTPAGGSSLPPEIALTVNEADFKIELVLQNKDIALLQKLNKKLQSFLKREKVVLSTTPAGGSSGD